MKNNPSIIPPSSINLNRLILGSGEEWRRSVKMIQSLDKKKTEKKQRNSREEQEKKKIPETSHRETLFRIILENENETW